MRDYQELLVWQRAHALTLRVYEVTRTFPAEERFGLTSQLRRACASVAANIAEGCGRNGDAELARFLTIALGSLAETTYFLRLAHDLAYLSGGAHVTLGNEATELRKMLITFHRKLKPLKP